VQGKLMSAEDEATKKAVCITKAIPQSRLKKKEKTVWEKDLQKRHE